jgi:hypothetical protein
VSLLARRTLKAALAPLGAATAERRPGITFLVYHKVGGGLPLELDLPQPVFARQLELILERGPVLAFDAAVRLLEAGAPLDGERFVLTFDDGFEDVYTQVFPLASRLGLPLMLYPTTGFLETGIPDGYGTVPRDRVRPLTWEMIGRMVESGLLTLGAHTHRHPDLVGLPEARIVEELETCRDLIRQRVGVEVRHFAYPRALRDEAAERVVSRYFETAVVGGGAKALPERHRPYRIPRVPVRRSDGLAFFRARIAGRLALEERLYERLHALTGR